MMFIIFKVLFQIRERKIAAIFFPATDITFYESDQDNRDISTYSSTHLADLLTF